MNWSCRQWAIAVVLLVLANSCSEAPLISKLSEPRLSSPIAITSIPGTSLALVLNANVNLSQPEGSLVALDLDRDQLLWDKAVAISSFCARMYVDVEAKRIYISDRAQDGVLVFNYAVSADGRDVDIVPVDIGLSNIGINHVPTEEEPFDLAWSLDSAGVPYLLITHGLAGSVVFLRTDDFFIPDLDLADGEQRGLRLAASVNYSVRRPKPGLGANRLIPLPGNQLMMVTSTATNNIFVINVKNKKIEAMMDLSNFAAVGGTRGGVVSQNNVFFVAHATLNAVLVLDVSHISANGVYDEVVEPRLIRSIFVGRNPDDVVLNGDETLLFVASQQDNTISVIRTSDLVLLHTIPLSGKVPSQMLLDESRNLLYVTQFLSNNIGKVDLTSMAVVGDVQ